MAIWLKLIIAILISFVGIIVTAAILEILEIEKGAYPTAVGSAAAMIFWFSKKVKVKTSASAKKNDSPVNASVRNTKGVE